MPRNDLVTMKTNVSGALHAGDNTSRAAGWINSSIDVIHRRNNWEHLKVVGTLTLSASTQEYDFTDFTITNSPEVQRVLWLRIRAESQYLSEVAEETLGRIDPNEQDNESRPEVYYVRGTTIGFYPVPDTTYTVDGRLMKRKTEMSSDSDVPDLPIDWTDVIETGAKMFGWQYLKGEGSQEYVGAKQAFEQGILDMVVNKDRKPNRKMQMASPQDNLIGGIRPPIINL